MGSARVTILAKASGSGDLRPFRDTPLGDEGSYRVYDLPPGQYAIALWYANIDEG